MNKIILKLATEKKISIFLALEKSVMGSKTYSGIDDEVEVKEEFKNNIVYLIQNGNETVGSIEYEMKSSEHAYISGLVVKPEFQGKGIGREALKQLLEKIGGLKRIDLVTHPDNTSALKLYKSFGFVVESRKENYYGDGEPRFMLAKIK
jgi:ribosomal protein S18 acetylase RimI-like enzyme